MSDQPGGRRGFAKGLQDHVDNTRKAVDDAKAGDEGGNYLVEVNKGSINVGRLQRLLNTRWRNGWRLDHVLEQDGNTVLVFARRGD